MYLVSLYENEGIVEASLGGRVTADEVRVFGEELMELLDHMPEGSFEVVLDHSRARRMDAETVMALSDVKDELIQNGASMIWSIAADDSDRAMHQTVRLQHVLEGTENFVAEPNQVKHQHRSRVQERRRRAA
ncbi:hypothetical protein EON82_13445 [bacterium]|nr:MAG: hypothetical protein EON82_13445 [bacterium]